MWLLLQNQKRQGWDELLCLGVHYTWYLGLVFSHLSLAKGLLFVLMTQMICGFFLSIVFVQSHNGMEVYSTEKDFVTAQVVSTRDIVSGLWNDWFTGKHTPLWKAPSSVSLKLHLACGLAQIAWTNIYWQAVLLCAVEIKTSAAAC